MTPTPFGKRQFSPPADSADGINNETMKKTIWKYPLQAKDLQTLNLPFGSQVLTAQTQNEEICIWALVNPETKETEERSFEIFGTGHPVSCDMRVDRRYISTVQLHGGALVFHVFERIN